MKRTQPETSEIARVNKTDESKQRDYDRIVLALQKIGSGNYEDISRAMKEKELNVVSRRLSEMVKKGMVENTGIKKKTSRNCPAFIYKVCDGVKVTATKIVDDMVTLSFKKVQQTHNPLFD